MVPPRLQTLQRRYRVIAESIPFRWNEPFGAAKEPFAFARGYRDEEEANQYQSSSHMQGSRMIENILSIFPAEVVDLVIDI